MKPNRRNGFRGPRVNGYAIRDLRKQAGLSQQALSATSGVSQSHISLLERGDRQYPSPRITTNLAAALGVPTVSLLAEVGA